LQCSLFAKVFDLLIAGDESQLECPRRLLDQNEDQYCNLVRDIALDGPASRTADILSPLHTREILAENYRVMSPQGIGITTTYKTRVALEVVVRNGQESILDS